MYETITVEDIKTDILRRMTTDIDTREGSFTNDMISTVAYEIWKAYQSLDAILPIVYVDETSGEFIDKKCAEYGIKRKAGTKATTLIKIIGTNGTVIPQGKIFLTADGLEFIIDETVTIMDGVVSVTASASELGSLYNVPANTITNQYVNLNGITSISNSPAKGGTDQESDTELVKRLYNHLQRPATSGNVANYMQWAMEVDGVGNAKVFPLWNGPGTVKVIIVDSNQLPATITLIEKVINHINDLRPIGAMVTVASARAKPINITATLTMAPGYNLQSVLNGFMNNLSSYFQSIVFGQSYISYAMIGNLLLNTEGVVDYSNLLINTNNVNIILDEDEIPSVGSIDLEV